MLTNILYKALLKISKENKDNNYIYSDLLFPKTLLQKKIQKEKQNQLFSKKILSLYKLYDLNKSKTTKIKISKELVKNNKKQRNKGDKFNILSRLSYLNKPYFNSFSSFQKGNKYNSQKNVNKLNDIKFKYNINSDRSRDKPNNLNLTPKKSKTFLIKEKSAKNNLYALKKNSIETNSAFNFHVLNINAPKEQIKKSMSSKFFNLNIFADKFKKKKLLKLITLKSYNPMNKIQRKLLNEDEKNLKFSKQLFRKFDLKLNSNLIKKGLKYSAKENSLSSYYQKSNNKNLPPKLLPLIQIKNYKENYFSISEIENFVNKVKEELPLYKNISISNNDIYYYDVNKMYFNQIREYMKHRINWEFIGDKNSDKNIVINFSWRYYSNRVNYKKYKYNPELLTTNSSSLKKLRMVNLFERNFEVGNKKYMFLNLINYCDQNNLNVFDVVPFTVIINNNPEVELALEALKDIVLFVGKNKSNDVDIISNRKYNEHFWFDKNYEDISKQYININKNFLSQKNYWIVKPTDLYQGKCIDIFSSYNQIYKQCKNIFRGVTTKILPENKRKDDLSNFEPHNNITSNNMITNIENELNNTIYKRKTFYSRMYCSNEIIIQKYLDNPFLYNKRKFDIRCFVLIDHNLNLFFFREGHLKACSELYDLKDRNRFIHITNYSLQKKSLKFETYEEGNEISYNDFKKFLISENIPLSNFDKMISQMKLLVEISMKAVGKKLLRTTPVLSFEIFGYDFIIDNEFKPWILEINNNPGLVISSPVIQKIIPRMLDDAFRLTIDKVFDTKYDLNCKDENWNYKSKFKIEGFSDNENVFEFLCNIK